MPGRERPVKHDAGASVPLHRAADILPLPASLEARITLIPLQMRRLVLLDIDGTILDSGGTAARAFLEALREVFGAAPRRDGYSFAGKTDPQIARDLLTRAGVPESAIEGGLPHLWERYLARLAEVCEPRHVSVYPGVRELIDRLHDHPDIVLGLLTGNLADGARLKLTAAGFAFDRFVAGAFGSDHPARSELPAIAIERAARRLDRRFQGKEVVVIGDTPHDISCGAHLGVRTLAVATGSYSLRELEMCGPDYLFDTLSGTEEVLEAILGEGCPEGAA
jgi:phosphoglycolate phosphatase